MSNLPTLADLMTEKPASGILLEKPDSPKILDIKLEEYSTVFWSQISSELVKSYNFGKSLGKFGDNKKELEQSFSRFATAIIETSKNLLAAENNSSEVLLLHFTILINIMRIIGKNLRNIENKKLKKQQIGMIEQADITTQFVATMHGFIEEYSKQIKNQ